MNERLFLSLGEQLKHKIGFISNVSRPYYKPTNEHTIIDFKYGSQQYQLVLNGDIRLKTTNDSVKIESYDDLVHGLIQSKKNSR